jgi:hypothetical protein
VKIGEFLPHYRGESPTRCKQTRFVGLGVAFPRVLAAGAERPPDGGGQVVFDNDARLAAKDPHERIAHQPRLTRRVEHAGFAASGIDLRHELTGRPFVAYQAITELDLRSRQLYLDVLAGQSRSSILFRALPTRCHYQWVDRIRGPV